MQLQKHIVSIYSSEIDIFYLIRLIIMLGIELEIQNSLFLSFAVTWAGRRCSVHYMHALGCGLTSLRI
jgi:hypothetical protein